jgi:hypothetical protein
MPPSARLILIAGPFLILTGVEACSGPSPSPPVKDAQAHRDSSSTGTGVSELSLATTKAVVLEQANALSVTGMTYPGEAVAVPGLEAWLRQDFAQLAAATTASTKAMRADAFRSGGTAQLCVERLWWLAGVTPRWISLSVVTSRFAPGSAQPSRTLG